MMCALVRLTPMGCTPAVQTRGTDPRLEEPLGSRATSQVALPASRPVVAYLSRGVMHVATAVVHDAWQAKHGKNRREALTRSRPLLFCPWLAATTAVEKVKAAG